MITRHHFLGYVPGCAMAPPPLHVVSINEQANHVPLARPMEGGPVTPGPRLVVGGTGLPCLGIDPTDASTWGDRGYRESAGMIGRFNENRGGG